MSWENFFNNYIGFQVSVKITNLGSENIFWESMTGKIDYNSRTGKLQFKDNERGNKFEFEIVEVDPENNTFTSLNKSKFKIELNDPNMEMKEYIERHKAQHPDYPK